MYKNSFRSERTESENWRCLLRWEHNVLCEVIAIEKENNMLLPFEQTERVCYGDSVTLIAEDVAVPCGNHLLGKVLSANGEVLNENAENIPLQK